MHARLIQKASATNQNKVSRQGLTLIETLVVVAILAVLIALSFPVIQRMQNRSLLVSDISNLRQIASAALLYAGDHSMLLPTQGSEESPWKAPFWSDQLRPYAYPEGVKPNKADVFFTKAADANSYIAGYGNNSHVIVMNGKSPITMMRIPEPSQIVMFCNSFSPLQLEQGTYHANWWINSAEFISNPLSKSLGQPQPRPAKHGKVAVVFCDGHTEAFDLETLAERPEYYFGKKPF